MPRRRTVFSSETAWARIQYTADSVSGRQSLQYFEDLQASQAVEILTNEQTSAKRRQYRTFLYNVLAKSGPELTLIVAIAFGQAKIFDMSQGVREAILLRLPNRESARDFHTQSLKALCVHYSIPQNIGELAPPSYPGKKWQAPRRDQRVPAPPSESSPETSGVDHSTRGTDTNKHTLEPKLCRFLSLSFQACYPLQMIAALINNAGQTLGFARHGAPGEMFHLSEHIGTDAAKFRVRVTQTVMSEMQDVQFHENGFRVSCTQVARLFECDAFVTSNFYPTCGTSTPVRPGLHIVWDTKADTLFFF